MTAWETLEHDTVIGGAYRIVRLLGRGGSGEVYEALHERTGASLAIKILRAGFSGKTELLARFQREAEVTSRLHHPNIVKVFDFDCLPDGRPFLAMELLTGKDLGTILKSREPLPLERVLDIVDQVALALATTHGAGIVHRDLSPGNVFIERISGTNREMARVLDFGISKVRDAGSGLTHTTTIMGTPYYMSPEQAQGHARETDARADQFALAAIVYEMLSGQRAFSSDDPTAEDPATAILYRVVHHDPPPFAALGLDVPAPVEAVVFKGLAKDPAKRYRSIIHFSDALLKAAREAGFDAYSADGSSTIRGALALAASSSSIDSVGPLRRRSSPGMARAKRGGGGFLSGAFGPARRRGLFVGAALLVGAGSVPLIRHAMLRQEVVVPGGRAAVAAPPAPPVREATLADTKPPRPPIGEGAAPADAPGRLTLQDDAPAREPTAKPATAAATTTEPVTSSRKGVAKRPVAVREAARPAKRRKAGRSPENNGAASASAPQEQARPHRNEDIY